MEVRTISVKITGITPLIMNRFTDENALAVSGGVSLSLRGDKGTPREQAEKKVYADENGIFHIPGPNIFRAIIDAGAFHKAGKSKVTTARSSLVPAAMSIVEVACPLRHPDGENLGWEVDSRSVVIPSTGGRVMRYRPRFDRWGICFTCEVDVSMFGVALVRQLIDDAGRRVGLGDFRPSRKGPYGRFVVDGWAID